MEDWIALLNDAPPGAPWAAEIRALVEDIAREEGMDVAARLPPAPAQPAAPVLSGVPQKGPSEAEVAAAGKLAAQDQSAMIAGMVDGLEARLKSNPRDAEGWAMLIRSRMNLGQTRQAADAYRRAREAFAGSPAEQAALARLAREQGVPGV